MSFSRRQFIKGAATVAGVAAVNSVLPSKAEARGNLPKKWDYVYDVIVIGYGGAGAAAAIAAHDQDAKVAIFEKMHEGGGNTAVSSGGYICPTDYEGANKYIKHLFELSYSDIDEEQVDIFTKESLKLNDFVESLQPGVKQYVYGYAGFQFVDGYESIRKFRIKGKKRGGDNLFSAYRNAVETVRNIPVYLNSPAKELIINGEGEAVGAVVTINGKDCNVRANKGVVLTTGGFEYNMNIIQNYVKGYPVYALGNPGNTGDGIKMAQKAGAQLWHMTGTSCPLGVRVPGLKACFQVNMLAASHFWVDQDGKRFVNEKGIDNHARLLAVDFFDSTRHKYPRIPCYIVFDEKARKRGPITGGATSGYAINRENYVWSRDNSAEVEKGVIVKADTMEELAKKIDVDPSSLKETFEKWNTDIKNGKDTLFNRKLYNSKTGKPVFEGREAPIVSEPLDEKGPYYAAKMYPTFLNSQGGPKRNAKSQVLDPYNNPIPRLYAAGELGSFWGLIYQGAGNNAESMVFGTIAGKNVAKLKSWT